MTKKDPRVDAYIARSAEFARPILKHLRTIVRAGCPAARGPRQPKPPDSSLAPLARSRKALAPFEIFTSTNKKDYVDWVTEAKGEDPRRRRLDTAVAWMAEGKTRNWKYIDQRRRPRR